MPTVRFEPSALLAARRGVAGVALALLALASPAAAQEEAGAELRPAELSPDEPVAIRVDELRAGAKGTEVVVTLANHTREPVTATLECSLFDAEREDLGTANGVAEGLAAGAETTVTLAGPGEGAKRAYCQVKKRR